MEVALDGLELGPGAEADGEPMEDAAAALLAFLSADSCMSMHCCPRSSNQASVSDPRTNTRFPRSDSSRLVSVCLSSTRNRDFSSDKRC